MAIPSPAGVHCTSLQPCRPCWRQPWTRSPDGTFGSPAGRVDQGGAIGSLFTGGRRTKPNCRPTRGLTQPVCVSSPSVGTLLPTGGGHPGAEVFTEVARCHFTGGVHPNAAGTGIAGTRRVFSFFA